MRVLVATLLGLLVLGVSAKVVEKENKVMVAMASEDIEKLSALNLVQVDDDEAKMVIPVHMEVLGNIKVTGAVETQGITFADGSTQLSALPIGSVIDWWRPDESFPIPPGYALCDGTMVNNPKSPFNGLNLPDLRGKFVRGADEKNIGETGGTAQHSHKFSIPANEHSFAVNFESFVASTDVSGQHTHQWAQFKVGAESGAAGATRQWFSFAEDGKPEEIATYMQGLLQQPGGYEFPVEFSRNSENQVLFTSMDGAHSHNIKVQIPPVAFNTTTPATTVCSDEEESLPPYVGLLKIMRVI